MISVIQNFICTKEKRLNLIRNEVPNMGKIFKDYEFFINYNTKHYLDEVYEIYRKGIDNLNFYNNLEYNWGLVTLSLIEEVKTPYTMILCEDYEYRIDYDNWKEIINEFVEKDGSYMPIGRLWKYTEEKYHDGYQEGEKLWFYSALKSPGSSLSVDAIYKTDLLKERLVELQNYEPRRFPVHLPHHFEDIFIEPNGVLRWGKDVLCAIPKDIILMHNIDDTETYLNK